MAQLDHHWSHALSYTLSHAQSVVYAVKCRNGMGTHCKLNKEVNLRPDLGIGISSQPDCRIHSSLLFYSLIINSILNVNTYYSYNSLITYLYTIYNSSLSTGDGSKYPTLRKDLLKIIIMQRRGDYD